MGEGIGLVFADKDVAGLVEPGRDAMAPPELAADAPVLDVGQPLHIGGLPVFRHKLDMAFGHRCQRRVSDGALAAGAAVGQFIAGQVEEPLIGQHRFDHCIRALADRQ